MGNEAVKTPINKLGSDIKTIKKPYGVALNQAGEIIVTEANTSVVSIFSPRGEKLRTLDTRGTDFKEMSPYGVAVDGDDNILVVDTGNCRLLKFSRGGDLIAAVGSRVDAGPGQLNFPHGVCVNSVNGKVYVVNSGADCVNIFNSDLTFSSKFGSEGSANRDLYHPYDVASDRSGCVYVAEPANARVKVFTPDGVYLRQFGKEGSGNGELTGLSASVWTVMIWCMWGRMGTVVSQCSHVRECFSNRLDQKDLD